MCLTCGFQFVFLEVINVRMLNNGCFKIKTFPSHSRTENNQRPPRNKAAENYRECWFSLPAFANVFHQGLWVGSTELVTIRFHALKRNQYSTRTESRVQSHNSLLESNLKNDKAKQGSRWKWNRWQINLHITDEPVFVRATQTSNQKRRVSFWSLKQ